MQEALKKEITKSLEIELGKKNEEGRTGTAFGNNNAEVTSIHQRPGEMTQPNDCGRLPQTCLAVKRRRVERTVRHECMWTRERKRALDRNQLQITRLHDNIQERGSG